MSGTNQQASGEIGLSFVVVNFNMAGLVYKLVDAIRRQVLDQFSYEIIIGDNSTDPAFRVDGRYDGASDVDLVRLPMNEGFVKASASLLAMARNKYVVMLHPDVDFKACCLAGVIAYMEAHPLAGIVSPDLIYPDGTNCKIRLRFATPLTECKRVFNLMARGFLKRNVIRDEPLWDRKSDVAAEMTMSVCMVIRQEALRKIGPIAVPLWTYYFNDWLCLKIRQAGYTCHYVLDAVAIHFERFADASLYSRKADSTYKVTPIPVEGVMQKDHFIFLRSAHSWLKVLLFKLILSMEYTFLIMTVLPRYRKRRQDADAYWKALKIICHG
jgi:GT2 family glycosyltransferase